MIYSSLVALRDRLKSVVQAGEIPGLGPGDVLFGSQCRIQRRRRAAAIDLLEPQHGRARDFSDLRRQLQGPRQKLFVRNHFGDQTDPLGTRRIDHLTGHRQPAGHRRTDDMGQPGGHPAAGHDPDAGMGVGEYGALSGHQENAAERQLQPTGEGGAVDGTDQRCAQLARRGDAVPGLEFTEVGHTLGRRLFEVDARTECRIGPGQHDRPYRLIAVGRDQRLVQDADHFTAQGVTHLGPVEGDDTHGGRDRWSERHSWGEPNPRAFSARTGRRCRPDSAAAEGPRPTTASPPPSARSLPGSTHPPGPPGHPRVPR